MRIYRTVELTNLVSEVSGKWELSFDWLLFSSNLSAFLNSIALNELLVVSMVGTCARIYPQSGIVELMFT